MSVLRSDQRHLSKHFGGRKVPDLEPGFVPLGHSTALVVEGALVQIAASVVDAHLAGDHTLFVGEVNWLELGDGQPLIFHGGGYRALVEPYEWTEVWRDPKALWY